MNSTLAELIKNIDYLKAVLSCHNLDFTDSDSNAIHNVRWSFTDYKTKEFGKVVLIQQHLVSEDEDILKRNGINSHVYGLLKLTRDNKNDTFLLEVEDAVKVLNEHKEIPEKLARELKTFYGDDIESEYVLAHQLPNFNLHSEQEEIARVILSQPSLNASYELNLAQMEQSLNSIDFDMNDYGLSTLLERYYWLVLPGETIEEDMGIDVYLVNSKEYQERKTEQEQSVFKQVPKGANTKVMFHKPDIEVGVDNDGFVQLAGDALSEINCYLAPSNIEFFDLDLDSQSEDKE